MMQDGYAVTDDPANDQDMRRSVRFAHGRIDDKSTVVLLIAQRDPGRGATRTTYQIYRLTRDSVGGQFVLLSQTELPRRYCNADAALTAASGLMLREVYRGPRSDRRVPRQLNRGSVCMIATRSAAPSSNAPYTCRG